MGHEEFLKDSENAVVGSSPDAISALQVTICIFYTEMNTKKKSLERVVWIQHCVKCWSSSIDLEIFHVSQGTWGRYTSAIY